MKVEINVWPSRRSATGRSTVATDQTRATRLAQVTRKKHFFFLNVINKNNIIMLEGSCHCRCNEGQFRCSYGACIDVTLTCNKQQNCLDWSDEDGALCGPELLNKACRLPPARPGTFYETSTCESCRPGRVVDEATRLDFHCHEGWNLVGWNKSFCQNGRWQPAIPNCFCK